jgi:hypothetical protein
VRAVLSVVTGVRKRQAGTNDIASRHCASGETAGPSRHPYPIPIVIAAALTVGPGRRPDAGSTVSVAMALTWKFHQVGPENGLRTDAHRVCSK